MLTNYNSYPVNFDRTRILIKRGNGDELEYEWKIFYKYSKDGNSVCPDGQAFPVSIRAMGSSELRIEYELKNAKASENWFMDKDEVEEDFEFTLLVENMHKKLQKTLCSKELNFKIHLGDRVHAHAHDTDRVLSSFRIEKKLNFYNKLVETTEASSASH